MENDIRNLSNIKLITGIRQLSKSYYLGLFGSYLPNHGQVWLLCPSPIVDIKRFHGDELPFTILTSQNI